MTEGARNDKRFKSSHPLLVRCESWNDFVQLYAGDISQGGMFVVTDEPPEILSFIEVRLALPEGQSLVLKARVVHVIQKEEANGGSKRPGVGVEFHELGAAERHQIQQMIEFARWEGDSEDPIASYANHMFSMGSQKTTADVLATMEPAVAAQAAPQEAPRKKEPTQRTRSVKRNTQRVRKVGQPSDADKSVSSRMPRDPDRSVNSRMPRDPDRSVNSRMPRDPDKSIADQLPSDPDRSMAGPLPTSDTAKIKVAMTHIARKRFSEAIAALLEVLEVEADDPAARKWISVARARQHLANKDPKKALKEYELVLVVDENNKEALDFLHNFQREKRLKSLPFGRYFLKKKR